MKGKNSLVEHSILKATSDGPGPNKSNILGHVSSKLGETPLNVVVEIEKIKCLLEFLLQRNIAADIDPSRLKTNPR